ncbi:hypothetical protein BO70DRAFT_370770 [Aspergillus heteromorphus CBS 117.55]|uniref:NACHT domain-containing protein n=1 Tax=Aspergillus heteromorphus CBS 117.55 TaxID=1448321 RepID=A0A317WH89_9EURO|nr:uncharacterized protein BO70DRAFT_370770 [Aspergillus heteromorphus CBS 117.55]PWY83560.1 hypothetical protein BO70DRAFT_370770 [Aspergillus heteromorphus CBS 117.55]
MLDEIHPPLQTSPNDKNSYILGAIGNRNVVIACLPAGVYGTTSATTVASSMRFSFGSIHHLLMVGIGGGAPSESADIRLGDVVVSVPTARFEGVVQYDYGKTVQEGRFERTGRLNKPSTSLLTAITNLRAEYLLRENLLFESDYEHDISEQTCEKCDRERLVDRAPRRDDRPVVHYGLIASGNQVIKHAETRDRLAAESNILCFEMEAAGLMDNFPCLVIRGISDYSDSHKKKEWQGYAAATAAAYAKELLLAMGGTGSRPLSNTASPVPSDVQGHRRRVMDALTFDALESRQATIKAAHAKSCKWLLQKQEYLEWLDYNRFPEHHGLLWIKGKAGSGKSTMMKFAFQQALTPRQENNVTLSFFFNARGEDLEKTTFGMYRSLLFQLLERLPEVQVLLDEVDPSACLDRNENGSWNINILQHLFRRAIALLGGRRVVCFIDALDECDEEQIRVMIDYFESLGDHAASSRVQLNICFSSRHYPHITVEKGVEMKLEDQEGHAEDIARFLHSELKIGRSKQSEQIRLEILEKASGIFLWTVLVVQILNREFERGRLHALRKRLREIPGRLSDLFRDILTRDGANMDDLLLCIQWILFAKRPLKREELYFALLSEEPESLAEAWDPEDITLQDMDRFITSTSKGLAEITKSKGKTVQFIHESVRDYLLKENGLQELWPDQTNFGPSSHDRLKQCCHNFLQSNICGHVPTVEEMLVASREKVQLLQNHLNEKFPFLEYAVHNVLYHADAAEGGFVDQNVFLDNFDLANWVRYSNAFEIFRVRRHELDVSLLYILAERNLANLIKNVRQKAPDVHVLGGRYQEGVFEETSVYCAAEWGREDILRLILQTGKSNPTIPNHHGGHVDIAQLLLDTGKMDVNAKDNCGDTALHYTVGCNNLDRLMGSYAYHLRLASPQHHVLMDVLLASNSLDPDIKNKEGITPFSYAASKGQIHACTRLLATGRVDPDPRDNYGKTPLSHAAKDGDLGIVNLLLNTGKHKMDI